MKDISSVKINREAISKERIVNKIQDIVWDDVFEQYFLHPEVIIFGIIKRIGATAPMIGGEGVAEIYIHTTYLYLYTFLTHIVTSSDQLY